MQNVFRENQGVILIQDTANNRFTCPAAEFAGYEPTYTPLSGGLIHRTWTETKCSCSDGQTEQSDPTYTPAECLAYLTTYVGKINVYQAAYAIVHPPLATPTTLYLHYTLTPKSGRTELQTDGVPLMRNVAQDVLTIQASVRVSQDPTSALVPQTSSWPIRLRYDNGDPAFNRVFHPSDGIYTIDIHFNNKQPVRHCVFDSDFAQVTIAGVTYQFKQAIPLKIDVYEESD